MLHLKEYLRVYLKVIEDVQEGAKRTHLTFYLMVQLSMNMTVRLRCPGWFIWRRTFEVYINGEVEVTIELRLKIHMVMHMLVQMNAQNHLIKFELEEALYVAYEGAPKISL